MHQLFYHHTYSAILLFCYAGKYQGARVRQGLRCVLHWFFGDTWKAVSLLDFYEYMCLVSSLEAAVFLSPLLTCLKIYHTHPVPQTLLSTPPLQSYSPTTAIPEGEEKAKFYLSSSTYDHWNRVRVWDFLDSVTSLETATTLVCDHTNAGCFRTLKVSNNTTGEAIVSEDFHSSIDSKCLSADGERCSIWHHLRMIRDTKEWVTKGWWPMNNHILSKQWTGLAIDFLFIRIN